MRIFEVVDPPKNEGAQPREELVDVHVSDGVALLVDHDGSAPCKSWSRRQRSTTAIARTENLTMLFRFFDPVPSF